MKNERKLEVLAKYFGWERCVNFGCLTWRMGHGWFCIDPLNDFFAAHVHERKLVGGDKCQYSNSLSDVVFAETHKTGWELQFLERTATAPQRFDAIIKTLELWEE